MSGRRFGTEVYGPRGVGVGAVPYIDADGLIAWLAYPEGAALGDYLLTTGDDGVPVWTLATDVVGSSDYAWLYMTTVDETGATVLMSDSDGNPILTYAPVG